MGIPVIGTIIEAGKGLLGGVTDLIDTVSTTDEERAAAKVELQKILNQYNVEVLKAENALVNAQRDVLVAEIQGSSWMQRNWRPSLMFVFMAILVNNYVLLPYFYWAKDIAIPTQMWGLITLAVGGYIGGRTFEKIKSKDSNGHG